MFVLHVTLKPKSGEGQRLEKDFLGAFKTAITAQPGFKAVSLLRADDGGDHLLSIAFENQDLQQKWVATDLHQEVWPTLEKHLDGYTVRTFSAV
jgi:heme-degrading monooxygenase HmoA